MTWADLDKLAVARPRADRRATLVVRDERTADAILENRPLSTVIAIARVLRGRHAVAERHGGQGVVVYATRPSPPSFLVEAVGAAGGLVFDGLREHASAAHLATTIQLDAACCDLATAVRRRLGVRSFTEALDHLEHDVRRRQPSPADPVAWWTAIVELAAVAGEVVRGSRAARWIEAPAERLPIALSLGKGALVFPGRLAQAIATGSTDSLFALIASVRPPAPPAGLARPRAGAGSSPALLPRLCDRRTVPIDQLIWEPVVAADADTPALPVIVYADDRGDALASPGPPGPPTAELRARALANLAELPFELAAVPAPGGTVVVVTGGSHGAEAILDPATMERVRGELGGPSMMFVGVPARGHLIAIDGHRALLDDAFQRAFLVLVEEEHRRAAERDRISRAVIVYHQGPRGHLQASLPDGGDAGRPVGVDPDG